MPRPRSKPTDAKVTEAAVKIARQHLMRLVADVTSWTNQGIGPTRSIESRREHAKAFLNNALLPDASDDMREIARNVALPILTQERSGSGRPSDARRDQILRDTVELVCETYSLDPTRRSGQAESGCSIVAMALAEFLAWLRKYPDELLGKFPDLPKYRERRRYADTELRKLPEKLFPEGVLSEERMNNIWGKRPRG
jgi:hypothetical protein